MNRSEVLAQLQALFNDIFLEPIMVTAELSAADVEEWDSLLQITIVVAVEKAFGIRFRVGEVEKTRNLGDFADLIIKTKAGN